MEATRKSNMRVFAFTVVHSVLHNFYFCSGKSTSFTTTMDYWAIFHNDPKAPSQQTKKLSMDTKNCTWTVFCCAAPKVARQQI